MVGPPGSLTARLHAKSATFTQTRYTQTTHRHADKHTISYIHTDTRTHRLHRKNATFTQTRRQAHSYIHTDTGTHRLYTKNATDTGTQTSTQTSPY